MTNNTTTPSRQEMIDAIYEKIADKTLNFGCRIIIEVGGNQYYHAIWTYGEVMNAKVNDKILNDETFTISEEFDGNKISFESFGEFFYPNEDIKWDQIKETAFIYKIIGHPVMIGDVMDFIMKNENIDDEEKHGANHFFFYYWQEKRKPIEEQDDECVEFVYNLISQ